MKEEVAEDEEVMRGDESELDVGEAADLSPPNQKQLVRARFDQVYKFIH